MDQILHNGALSLEHLASRLPTSDPSLFPGPGLQVGCTSLSQNFCSMHDEWGCGLSTLLAHIHTLEVRHGEAQPWSWVSILFSLHGIL